MSDVKNIYDPDWRLRNLYYIRTKAGKSELFVPNATQEYILENGIYKSNLNMILKGRQQGVSTLFLLERLDKACFTKNYSGAILSHDRESIEKLFRVIKWAYEHMPPEMRPELSRGGGSKYSYYFPSMKSRIFVALEVRSEAITDLHVSEYAFMPKDRFNASIEAVPVDGCISIESTPLGLNHFHKDWNNPNFPYIKHFFPWYFHKENQMPQSIPYEITNEETELREKAKKLFSISLTDRQLLWRRFKISQSSRESFLQEHPEDDQTCFLTSGNSVFDLVELSQRKSRINPPLSERNGIKILEKYNSKNQYVIGADTAEGVGGDRSAAVIYNCTERKVAAQIHGQFKPKIFAELLAKMGHQYAGNRGMCSIAVERNNHGHAVLLWLDAHCQYPYLYEDTDGKHGWRTNKATRPILLDEFIDMIDNDISDIGTSEIMSECMTLIDNSGKIEAADGEHDDLIIAYAIAIQAAKKSQHYLHAWVNNI